MNVLDRRTRGFESGLNNKGLTLSMNLPFIPFPHTQGIIQISEMIYDQVAGYCQYLFIRFAFVQQYSALCSQVNGFNICRVGETEL